ncbi:hypothetical protein [Pararhizobium arenae]|uniref:O-linked N-acetylglucosamine transferase, SPINDLY family protein n=1 Tax=Pararhizobium arenae TaxID=1856850 RepID=UPI00094AF0FB|nr:hypothetical protein [Pararhizobium arenae]
MSAIFQSALKNYSAGKYRQCLLQLSPLLKRSDATTQALLLAAQCHAKMEQFQEAAGFYTRAAQSAPDKGQMLKLMAATMLTRTSQTRKALQAARIAARSGAFSTDAEETFRRCLHGALNFDECAAEDQRFLTYLKHGDNRYLAVEKPFDHITWCADEAINARQTRVPNTEAFTAQSRAERRSMPHTFASKIRLGYLSADFIDQHATMRLFQGALMQHDPEKFDVTLFCHTPESLLKRDGGLRRRYGRIVPIGHLSDDAAADLIRHHGIDILVDLKGHTKHARPGLVNRGAAPIQVAYLGYPGSATGIDCDYIISDRIVTPDTSKPYYHEKLCRMPESYQANDDTWRALPPALSRRQLGLPENAIVFAAFNAIRKVTPATASLWMKILKATGNSVLWMLCEDHFARDNMLNFVEANGIARDRILFTDGADYEVHIARLRAADIGLDTFPYNGHTTTSDKLWAGLPVPTMKGTHFASRVSESLLTALDVPELIAENARDYVALCTRLATDHAALRAMKEKLAENRFRAPLFDTERFTRHLESAYAMMIARAREGLEPDHLDVATLPPRTTPFRYYETEDELTRKRA